MKFSKEQLLLYVITDSAARRDIPLKEQVRMALEGGATIVQLREKNLSVEAYIAAARELAPICHEYNAPLIVNDNPEAAVKGGADGVHVGIDDISVRELRQIYGADLIIGATAKTVGQAQNAERQGADYLGVGAVFPSMTKPGAVRVELDALREISASVNIPCAAIGGINAENALRIKGCGVCGIAVVSAVFGAENIECAARRLKSAALSVTEQSKSEEGTTDLWT